MTCIDVKRKTDSNDKNTDKNKTNSDNSAISASLSNTPNAQAAKISPSWLWVILGGIACIVIVGALIYVFMFKKSAVSFNLPFLKPRDSDSISLSDLINDDYGLTSNQMELLKKFHNEAYPILKQELPHFNFFPKNTWLNMAEIYDSKKGDIDDVDDIMAAGLFVNNQQGMAVCLEHRTDVFQEADVHFNEKHANLYEKLKKMFLGEEYTGVWTYKT